MYFSEKFPVLCIWKREPGHGWRKAWAHQQALPLAYYTILGNTVRTSLCVSVFSLIS